MVNNVSSLLMFLTKLNYTGAAHLIIKTTLIKGLTLIFVKYKKQ